MGVLWWVGKLPSYVVVLHQGQDLNFLGLCQLITTHCSPLVRQAFCSDTLDNGQNYHYKRGVTLSDTF